MCLYNETCKTVSLKSTEVYSENRKGHSTIYEHEGEHNHATNAHIYNKCDLKVFNMLFITRQQGIITKQLDEICTTNSIR